MGGALPDPATLDEQARQILSRPEYHLVPRAADSEFSFGWLRPFLEWLEPLLAPLFWLFNFSPVLYYLVLGVLCVVTIVLIYRLILMLKIAFAPVSVEAYSDSSGLQIQVPDLEDKISRLATSGRWEEALRWLVLAAILRIEPNPTRRRRGTTNRAYLLRFQRQPVGPPLAVLVETFDQCWYGQDPLTVSDYDRCQSAYRDIVTRTAAPSP